MISCEGPCESEAKPIFYMHDVPSSDPGISNRNLPQVKMKGAARLEIMG